MTAIYMTAAPVWLVVALRFADSTRIVARARPAAAR